MLLPLQKNHLAKNKINSIIIEKVLLGLIVFFWFSGPVQRLAVLVET